jgi:NAD(P)-dependent dehydrogenase (short-subunit alcohol dehydrogenase family)
MIPELFDLTGRVVLVTGGSQGIGFAIAEGLASSGADVVIVNRRAAQGRAAAEGLAAKGLKVTAIEADVSTRPAVERLVSRTLERHPRIDVLVNSAARIIRKPIEDVTDEDWDALMNVNLRGLFLCCQLVGRQMIRQGGGKIVNIASNIVQPLQPHRGLYAVTKAGVAQLTRVLALEWAAHRVTVNAIAPAPTITELNRAFFAEHPQDLQDRVRSIPLGRMGAPKDYVGMAVLLASSASDFITGQTIFVDGGTTLL